MKKGQEFNSKTIYLSFDVEDWFQVENLRKLFPPETWEKHQSRVEENTIRILQLLRKWNVKSTFFILGWIAERYPKLVQQINQDGHEIASHGYGHIINYQLTREEIFQDIKKSKKILEEISGKEVIGYRAPNFSVTEDVIDALIDLGFFMIQVIIHFQLTKDMVN
ncbi:polysaccharide deacetylase family protein [Thermosipho africanus]|uniref:polysaccharide deacetylase family protein n=1 Tax=Thermosipho africanus TaxID=2421 RepID=UPI00031CFC6C|nr:polysaccharide deacetylase family protein [Thermosipho africanus]